jgi:hypothetical protein
MDREKQIEAMRKARERAEEIANKTLASPKVRALIQLAREEAREARRQRSIYPKVRRKHA